MMNVIGAIIGYTKDAPIIYVETTFKNTHTIKIVTNKTNSIIKNVSFLLIFFLSIYIK